VSLVGKLVAECVGIVRASGLPNETNAMFTNVEGEWDEVMHVIRQCVDHVARAAPRVSVVVKIDLRPGVSRALHSKVESVEQRLSSMLPAHGPDLGSPGIREVQLETGERGGGQKSQTTPYRAGPSHRQG
jgi:uncharacterized protein (TIGR00106 family)